jgi:hypothetical protein
MSADRTSVFPFFVGCGRSGTTLIRAMFDSHSQMAIPTESHFITSLARRRRRYGSDGVFNTEQFISDLFQQRRFRRWGLEEQVVKEAVADSVPDDYPDAIRSVFALYAHLQGKHRYGDKTVRYLVDMRSLASLFPEAKFVHIIRDGRDVALSVMDVGTRRIEEAALYWKRHVARGRTVGRRLGPTRYQEVQYEDVLSDPEAVLRGLCDFIDLRFEEAMLRYFERADHLVQGVGRPTGHQRLFLPPTQGLRDWRRQMSGEHVALFEAVAGDALTRMGYERATPRVGATTRLRASARLLEVGARRLAHVVQSRDRKPRDWMRL